MPVYTELSDLALPQLIEHFWADAPDGPRYAFGYFAEVAGAIRDAGDAGVDFLLTVAKGVEIDRRRAIIYALADPRLPHPAARAVVVDSISDAPPLVVAEAIDGLAKLRAIDASERVLARRNHPSPWVRAAVIRYATKVDARATRELIAKGLSDSHHVVRSAAVDALVDVDDTDSIPMLRRLMEHDPHPGVRDAAAEALALLTGVEQHPLAGVADD